MSTWRGALTAANATAATALVDGRVVDKPPRCWRCGRALAEYAARPWSQKCQRCNAPNKSAPPPSE